MTHPELDLAIATPLEARDCIDGIRYGRIEKILRPYPGRPSETVACAVNRREAGVDVVSDAIEMRISVVPDGGFSKSWPPIS